MTIKQTQTNKGIVSFAALIVLATSMGFGALNVKTSDYFTNNSLKSMSDIVVAEEDEPVPSRISKDSEILWLARTLYSETKIKEEQVMVAWVIRNRMESPKYPDTYKGVVLQKSQFSGMNSYDKQYHINISLNYGMDGRGWNEALDVADAVYNSPSILRPFSKSVTHFYSPASVSSTPSWAAKTKASHTISDSENEYVRFAFYENIM